MSIKDTYVSAWESFSTTIIAATSLSDAMNLGGLRLFNIVIPALWTTANLTFQMSPDGGTTWANLYDKNGNEIIANANASTSIALDPQSFAPLQFLKIRSGTSATPVPQAADRALQLILRTV